MTEIEENGIIYLHLTQVSSLVGRRAAAVDFKRNVIDDESGKIIPLSSVNKIVMRRAYGNEEVLWEK